MKPTALFVNPLTAVLFFTTTASAASCGFTSLGVSQRWVVDASGVSDAGSVCGSLWDNLKRFSGCGVASNTFCGMTEGTFRWGFVASVGCNGGMVESTWYEATKNRFGGIKC